MPGESAASPRARYAAAVASGRISADPAQQAVLPELDRIHRALLSRSQTRARWPRLIRRWFPEKSIAGLYLHGGVGRGKTLLLDLLYDALPDGLARRVHFHRFMRRVHADLAALEDESDPLAHVALRIARRPLLCLDEFLVADIGDAMILDQLLTHLLGAGVVLVTTSNTAPKNLYRDGLQRARFLPAIARIEAATRVVELVSPIDWRLRALTRAPLYVCPNGPDADRALDALFARLAPGSEQPATTMRVEGREIAVKRRADGVVWFDFAALLDGPRSVADYIEIATAYSSVLVSDVPRFDDDNSDPAKRFVHLVDEFYDRGVKLVMSAAAPITALYAGTRLAAEFERTASRLIEMQSETYLARGHRT